MDKMIKGWNQELYSGEFADQCADTEARLQCAKELQAWMDGLWTEITEEPETWPEKGQERMCRIYNTTRKKWGRPWVQTCNGERPLPNRYWNDCLVFVRPLTCIDTPPKEDV